MKENCNSSLMGKNMFAEIYVLGTKETSLVPTFYESIRSQEKQRFKEHFQIDSKKSFGTICT